MMTYLLTQMFLYMLVTFLLGLLLGWLFWRYGRPTGDDIDAMRRERDSLLAERDALAVKAQEWEEERVALNTNLDACRARSSKARDEVERLEAELAECRASKAAPAVAAPVMAAVETESQGTRPEGLIEARGGVPDDLKQINGIGPKLEKMLFGMGYFHFDQIANWTSEELAWVDYNLEGFKGRATRDNWIPQAKDFARK